MNLQKPGETRDQDEACNNATELERRLKAMGKGSMSWNTHHIHVFKLPIHPKVDDDTCDHDEESSPFDQFYCEDDPIMKKKKQMLTSGGNRKRKKNKPCCCCCDKCQHRIKNAKPVAARWDNNKQCFVPCYRDRNHDFGVAPFYYR